MIITADIIDLFIRNKSQAKFAYGSPKYPQTISNADKELYWEIITDLKKSFQNVLDKNKLRDFYVKPKTFSKEKGVRGHRPIDLWCAIRNHGSEAFNEMPQIYAIISDRGLEIGFAVSIPEADYSDISVKAQNREIIPFINRKLPTSGKILDGLENLSKSSSDWHINSGTRKNSGDKGFDAHTSVKEMFQNLKSERVSTGGGCIAKVIPAGEIVTNSVDLEKELESALDVFSELLRACVPTAPDRENIETQKIILGQSQEEFNPDDIDDGKLMKLTSIAQRRGQNRFRSQLIEIYEGKCVISGSEVLEVLQAAHIVPYRGDETNKLDNGLLLRSDIHDLFDQFLLTVDPKTLTIQVSKSLKHSEYFCFNGKKLRKPSSKIGSASLKALEWHYEKAKSLGVS